MSEETPPPDPDPNPPAGPPQTYPGLRGSLWLVILTFVASLVGGGLVHLLGLGGYAAVLLLGQAALPSAVVAWYGWRRRAAPAGELLVLPRMDAAAAGGLVLGMAGFWVLLYQGFALLTMAWPIPEILLELLDERMGGSWYLAAPVLLVGASAEEVLFRGVILAGLLTRYEPVRAIVLSAVFFGIAHVVPWAIFSSFAGGLLLGWLYYRTRSLILCSVVHFVHNAGFDRFLSGVARLAGMEPPDVGLAVLPLLPLWLVPVAVALATGGFLLADRRLRAREA